MGSALAHRIGAEALGTFFPVLVGPGAVAANQVSGGSVSQVGVVLSLVLGTAARNSATLPAISPDALCSKDRDFIITVCNRAQETCPVFPGAPALAQGGMPDATHATCSDADDQQRPIDEALQRPALGMRVQEIGKEGRS